MLEFVELLVRDAPRCGFARTKRVCCRRKTANL